MRFPKIAGRSGRFDCSAGADGGFSRPWECVLASTIEGLEPPCQVSLEEKLNSQKTKVLTPTNSKLRSFWISCQRELFPWVEKTVGPLERRHKKPLSVLEMMRVERFLLSAPGVYPGVLGKDGVQHGYNQSVVERLRSDPTLHLQYSCRTLFGSNSAVSVPAA